MLDFLRTLFKARSIKLCMLTACIEFQMLSLLTFALENKCFENVTRSSFENETKKIRRETICSSQISVKYSMFPESTSNVARSLHLLRSVPLLANRKWSAADTTWLRSETYFTLCILLFSHHLGSDFVTLTGSIQGDGHSQIISCCRIYWTAATNLHFESSAVKVGTHWW